MPIFTLPQIDWKVFAEQRTRLVRKLDADFSKDNRDDSSELDDRTRVGLSFKAGPNLSGVLAYQYSHNLFWTPKKNFSSDGSDLFLAEAALRDHSATWILGRQIISKGAKRLIDVSDYSQRVKVYDGLRFSNRKWDAFIGRLGMTSNVKDHSKLAFFSYNHGEAGETMAVYHNNDDSAISDFTFDHRWTGTNGSFVSEVEGAVQTGRTSGRDLNSFWAHARSEYKLDPKTSIYGEANVVSGGGSSGQSQLFDPLYGTGHAPYGLLDVQGLRNLRHLEIGVTRKLLPKLSALASFNGYGLYDRRDGWYNTGGSINSRPGGSLIDKTGSSGSDVGREWNLGFTWTPSRHDTLLVQFGLFQPGHFVRNLIGPSTANEFFGLLSYEGKF